MILEAITPVTMADAAKKLGDGERDAFWKGYANRGEVTLVTAREKTGKTLFLMDLGRRCWFRETFPLESPNPLNTSRKTLWCMGDRQHRQVLERMNASSMPLDTVILAARPANPLGCLQLDDKDDLIYFVHLVKEVSVELAFIAVDTSWSAAPGFKVNDPADMGYFFGLLADLAGETRLPIFVTTHLNREGGTLGLRSNSIARMILKLTRADSNDRTKLRLDVDGNYKCGPALGLTILEDRIAYVANPPEAMNGDGDSKPGPKPEARLRAKAFIVAELAKGDRPGAELLNQWTADGNSERTFWDARRELIDEGRLLVDASRRPKMWHLVSDDDEEWLHPN
jgi:hypothetical protein